jgi:hypothetical protein
METIKKQLQEFIDNINFDLQQDWCEDKITNMLQLLKLQQALDLLKSLGENNNIN